MCVTGNGGVQSSPDNVTPVWVQRTVRGLGRFGAVPNLVARLAGMGNSSELLINTVTMNVPNLLIGTNQKVRGPAAFVGFGSTSLLGPPVER